MTKNEPTLKTPSVQNDLRKTVLVQILALVRSFQKFYFSKRPKTINLDHLYVILVMQDLKALELRIKSFFSV